MAHDASDARARSWSSRTHKTFATVLASHKTGIYRQPQLGKAALTGAGRRFKSHPCAGRPVSENFAIAGCHSTASILQASAPRMSYAVGSGIMAPWQTPTDGENPLLHKGVAHLRPRPILSASGSRSEEIHVQLSAISGLVWEGEVPGDGSCIFGFVLREAVVALQQHPGVLTLLIDTMVLSPSNALGLFTPGHSYDVIIISVYLLLFPTRQVWGV